LYIASADGLYPGGQHLHGIRLPGRKQPCICVLSTLHHTQPACCYVRITMCSLPVGIPSRQDACCGRGGRSSAAGHRRRGEESSKIVGQTRVHGHTTHCALVPRPRACHAPHRLISTRSLLHWVCGCALKGRRERGPSPLGGTTALTG
jgi:hypothetical protein